MFSFSFDIDESELDQELDVSVSSLQKLKLAESDPDTSISSLPSREVPLAELLATLPPLISFAPVTVPLTKSPQPRTATVLRRDLFDARFQIINQDEQEGGDSTEATVEDKGKGHETFVNQNTDLVKGVYEGGLKTWECSLDLIDCLDGLGYNADVTEERIRGTSVLEVGCGSALPTCALFGRLLAEIGRNPTKPGATRPARTRIHVQDYNKQVLSLITLPNILLAYAKYTNTPLKTPEADEDSHPDLPGDLEISSELLTAFEELLEQENIELKFYEGDWSGLTIPQDDRCDIVLTSETVYSLSSLPALLDLLEAACRPAAESLCLVACKRIYFGVGGGELEFRTRVENERQGRVETVWGEDRQSKGVGRTVMKVEWARR